VLTSQTLVWVSQRTPATLVAAKVILRQTRAAIGFIASSGSREVRVHSCSLAFLLVSDELYPRSARSVASLAACALAPHSSPLALTSSTHAMRAHGE
jgi:hypothetical protein